MQADGDVVGNGANERRSGSDQKDGSVTFWSKTERGIKAELRLQHHPYDTESWGVLIREAQNTPLETSRVLCEKLVRRFPNAGRYWRLYIEQEVFKICSLFNICTSSISLHSSTGCVPLKSILN